MTKIREIISSKSFSIYALPRLIFVLVLLSSIKAHAQQFTLLSATDSTAVPYANVAILGTTRGTFSNEAGKVQLALQPTDSVRISAVGYQPLLLPAEYAKGLVYLQPQVNQLTEVKVERKRKPFVVKQNFHRAKRHGGMVGSFAYLRWFDNSEGSSGKLQKVRLSFLRKTYYGLGEEFPLLLRVIMYSKDSLGTPSDHLVKNNIVLQVKAKAKKVAIDIEDEIFPAEGAFIGFEVIGYFRNDEFVPYSSNDAHKRDNFSANWSRGHTKPLSWVQRSVNAEWERVPLNDHNYNFGIEVAYD